MNLQEVVEVWKTRNPPMSSEELKSLLVENWSSIQAGTMSIHDERVYDVPNDAAFVSVFQEVLGEDMQRVFAETRHPIMGRLRRLNSNAPFRHVRTETGRWSGSSPNFASLDLRTLAAVRAERNEEETAQVLS